MRGRVPGRVRVPVRGRVAVCVFLFVALFVRAGLVMLTTRGTHGHGYADSIMATVHESTVGAAACKTSIASRAAARSRPCSGEIRT